MSDKFTYSYSAKEQQEIEQIRQKYIPKTESALDQMKKLDHQVTQKATMFAIAFGIVSALVLGLGMCLTMVWAEQFFYLGIVIGVVGIICVSLTLPLYRRVLAKERHKVADTIIQLSQEYSK